MVHLRKLYAREKPFLQAGRQAGWVGGELVSVAGLQFPAGGWVGLRKREGSSGVCADVALVLPFGCLEEKEQAFQPQCYSP